MVTDPSKASRASNGALSCDAAQSLRDFDDFVQAPDRSAVSVRLDCGEARCHPSYRHVRLITHFGRKLSTVTDPGDMLRLLAQASVDEVGASGAAVLQIGSDGVPWVAASAGITLVGELRIAPDEIGHELVHKLGEAAHQKFDGAHTFPLVSDTDLFGVLVLLFKSARKLDRAQMELAASFADLAGASLAKAYAYDELRRAHTELKRAYDVLSRTEKLRALGEMSAGISHDLKNILNPLGLHVQLLKLKSDDPERVLTIARALEGTLKRGVDILERLRTFSRQSDDEGTEFEDLNALVSEAVEITGHRGDKQRADTRVELGNLPRVRLASSEFVAVIVNLIGNARDALLERDRGTVTVRTGTSTYGAWVQIQDDGCGMPEEVRTHLFEPFFTTKGKQGTGLGLAMVRSFVQRYAGRIEVDTAPGHGTTITLNFPWSITANAAAAFSSAAG